MKKEKITNKHLALIFFCLFVLSLLFNIGQWDMNNQMEILKDAYKAEASIVVDSGEPKKAQMFKTIWTVQYNSISLPEMGIIDAQIRQKHNGSCTIKVELAPINHSGYTAITGGDMLYWNNDYNTGDTDTNVIWQEAEHDTLRIGATE